MIERFAIIVQTFMRYLRLFILLFWSGNMLMLYAEILINGNFALEPQAQHSLEKFKKKTN